LRAPICRNSDGIIVLGGVEDARVTAGRHTHAINETAERIAAAAALAQRFPRAKVVFTSGATGYRGVRATGADAAGVIFRDLGIAADRLITESASHNTWDNAVYTKALPAAARWARRGEPCPADGRFRKVGFPVEPWPVDTALPPGTLGCFHTPPKAAALCYRARMAWACHHSRGADELFPAP
jgi:uncharacterized SAM-binding protein YcdF (DUF218 family)